MKIYIAVKKGSEFFTVEATTGDNVAERLQGAEKAVICNDLNGAKMLLLLWKKGA